MNDYVVINALSDSENVRHHAISLAETESNDNANSQFTQISFKQVDLFDFYIKNKEMMKHWRTEYKERFGIMYLLNKILDHITQPALE